MKRHFKPKKMIDIEIYDYWRPSEKQTVSVQKIGRKYIYAGGKKFSKESGQECANPFNFCITQASFDHLKKTLLQSVVQCDCNKPVRDPEYADCCGLCGNKIDDD
jgi:hypothetical protein